MSPIKHRCGLSVNVMTLYSQWPLAICGIMLARFVSSNQQSNFTLSFFQHPPFFSAAVKFGRMSKKQRDSLYAEVQKHQQSQERAGVLSNGGPGHTGDEAGEKGISHGRAYSRGSSTTLSDLDDITTLPDGLLLDLPLTPEEAADYCSLELLGGSGGSSSSSQSSPEPSRHEFSDVTHIKHEYQTLHESGLYTRSLLNPPEGCSLMEIG